jgi:hypothetical protein
VLGYLEALGSALGEVGPVVGSTSAVTLWGAQERRKNEVPRQICGGLSHMGVCKSKRPNATGHRTRAGITGIYIYRYKHWPLATGHWALGVIDICYLYMGGDRAQLRTALCAA